MDSKTGCSSPGEREMTCSTSEVAVCCSSASERCPRASASSRVCASSCFFNSISEFPLLTCALAFVPVERSLRLRVGLFAPLRDKGHLVGTVTGRTRAASLDHLVGEREQLIWNFEAERLGRHDTDDQLVLGWHLDRQVAWLCAPENGRHVMRAGAAIGIGVACTVAHQTADQDKLANDAHRRHAMTRGERRQLPAPVVEQSAVTDKQDAGARLNDGRKCSIDFAYGLRIQGQELTPEFTRSARHLF